jgi:hypothetical protein
MALTGWQNGDFNYDNAINGDDYTLIDNAYNSQGSVHFSALPAEVIASDTTTIAKPSSAVLAVTSPDDSMIDETAELRKRRRNVVALLDD